MENEKKEKNYQLYLKKLSQIGVEVEALDEKYGEVIKNGTFTNSNEFGNAYDGSLLEIVLKTLTPYAIKLNEMLPTSQQVERNTLIKVCLLHHISKSVRLVENDNKWEVENRGILYKYNPSLPSIRNGLHSLVMAQECGISFTAEEAEAMTINDRDLTDDQSRWHSSVMASIVRMANELTYIQINKKQ